MRRFLFKLDKILELRRYHEQEWELKLAEATGRVVAAEQEITEWARRRHDTGHLHVGTGTVDMFIMRTREDYVIRIDRRVLELQHQLVSLEAERSKVRDGYLEAGKKRKALTKLKERQAEEYYRDALRDEGRVLDEIAGSQLIRSRLETEDIDV